VLEKSGREDSKIIKLVHGYVNQGASMTCVCGHSDDMHKEIPDPYDENGGTITGPCTACECEEFCEDIDEDELEVE
jgi:hypothetical protein